MPTCTRQSGTLRRLGPLDAAVELDSPFMCTDSHFISIAIASIAQVDKRVRPGMRVMFFIDDNLRAIGVRPL